jgi:hypothetical protein
MAETVSLIIYHVFPFLALVKASGGGDGIKLVFPSSLPESNNRLMVL